MAEKRLALAKSEFALVSRPARSEEIHAIEAKLRGLEANAAQLQTQVHQLNVKSPIEGQIVTYRLDRKLGQRVENGDFLARIHDLSTIVVELQLPEKEVHGVRIGQPMKIMLRSLPGRVFTSKVKRIAEAVETENSGVPTVLVTTQLTNADATLRSGMTGKAKIAAGRATVAEWLGRRLARIISVEFWSWW